MAKVRDMRMTAATLTPVPPDAHPIDHAPARRAARCACGKVLRQPATGRPRTSCSRLCRRRREIVRQREAWLRGWLERGLRGEVSAAELATAVSGLLEGLHVS